MTFVKLTYIDCIRRALGNTDVVVVPDGFLGYFWAYFARLRQVPVLNNIHTNAQQVIFLAELVTM